MYKTIAAAALIAIAIHFFYGEQATDIVVKFFNGVPFLNKTPVHVEKVFTKEQLKLFNGIERPELYLAILGNVFNVTKGAKHYGPNKQYNVFVGQDASRSFVTGEFLKKDVSEDVADFSYEQLRSLNHWLNFYTKEYSKVGLLNGKYFDEYGQETSYAKTVRNQIEKAEDALKENELEKNKFPPCNIEWDAEKGSRVWCSQKSGGIQRDWVGVPRQIYQPGLKSYRCACISENNEKLGIVKEYEDCDKQSISCFVKQN